MRCCAPWGPGSRGKMDKRKTRIVREKRSQGGHDTAPVSVSRIDLDRIKQRYAGEALPQDDDLLEEYEGQEEYVGGHASRRVADSDRELNIFGEDEENDQRAPREHRGLTLAFLGAMLITALVGLYFLLIVDTIRVGGNNTLEKGEVLTIAGLNPGEHLWFADIGGAKARLLADPMIKDAVISRIYPDTISIVITERRPAAAIVSGCTVSIIEAEGCVIEISARVPEDMVEVYGVSSSGFTAGQDLSEDAHFNAAALLDILTSLSDKDILGIIDYIDMSQPLRIEMTTVYGIHVTVGQAENIAEKLAPLPAVMAKVLEMGYQGGTIDLAVLGDPVYAPPVSEGEPAESPEPADGQDPNQGQAPGLTPAPQTSPAPQTAASPQPAAGGNTGQNGFSG